MLIIFLIVLGYALYRVSKTLLPEMAKPAPTNKPEPVASEIFNEDSIQMRIMKLETLLAEKNKNISLLQMELKTSYAQIHNFDKLKSLLEDEILHLREQNRMFRSELGLPAVVLKENSLT